MKTDILRLQGQDVVMTVAAREAVVSYLKKLQAGTHFRSKLYKQYVEALRDVLTTSSNKTISLASARRAVAVVGLPDASETAGSIFGSFVVFSRQFASKSSQVAVPKVFRSKLARNSIRVVAALGVIYTLFLGTGFMFSALMSRLQVSTEKSGWFVMDTSIGPVRSWQDISGSSHYGQWELRWLADLLLGVALLLIAYVLLLLLRRGVRLRYVITLFISICFALGLGSVQMANIAIPPESQIVASQSAIEPRLAYLQQCGDEIPYVFDGTSSGMLFRSLRDQGFTLATPIKTMPSNGTLDVAELCQQYDALRQTHAKDDVILEYYTREADGAIRTYDFSDIDNSDVTSTFGLFVK